MTGKAIQAVLANNPNAAFTTNLGFRIRGLEHVTGGCWAYTEKTYRDGWTHAGPSSRWNWACCMSRDITGVADAG